MIWYIDPIETKHKNGIKEITGLTAKRIENAEITEEYTVDGIKEAAHFFREQNIKTVVTHKAVNVYPFLSAFLGEPKKTVEVGEGTARMFYGNGIVVSSVYNMLGKWSRIRPLIEKDAEKMFCAFQKEFCFDDDNIPISASAAVRDYEARKGDRAVKTWYGITRKARAKTLEEYEMIENANWGGFSKTAILKAGETITGEIKRFDVTSMYSYVMETGRITPSNAVEILKEEAAAYVYGIYADLIEYAETAGELRGLNELQSIQRYFSAAENNGIVKVAVKNIKAKTGKENLAFLQLDKCEVSGSIEAVNARIKDAEELRATMTLNDFARLMYVYDVEDLTVEKCIPVTLYSTPEAIKRQVRDYTERKNAAKQRFKEASEGEKEMLEYIYSIEKLKAQSVYGNIAKKRSYEELQQEELDKLNKKRGEWSCRIASAFITAAARDLEFVLVDKVSEACNEWLYSDTDSAFALATEEQKKTVVDFWENYTGRTEKENGGLCCDEFDRMRFCGQKCYYIAKDDDVEVHIAGMDISEYARNQAKTKGIEELDKIITFNSIVHKDVYTRESRTVNGVVWAETGDAVTVLQNVTDGDYMYVSDPNKTTSVYRAANRERRKKGMNELSIDRRYILTDGGIKCDIL